MAFILGILARFAVILAAAFIVGKTAPRMPNAACRFVLLFVLGVTLNFVVNWFNVRLFGYHKMGWAGASVLALAFATFGTSFWPPQPRNNSVM